MLRKSLAGLFIVLGMALAAPAWSAGYAYVQGAVHLRAGPRIGYPIIMVLGMGSRVYVHGCVSDYSWCDVTADGMRGWVSASYLDYPYGGGYVPVIDYGPALGIGIISFSIISYWGNHYRHRPWYGERHHYRSRFGLHGRDGRPPRRWHRVAPQRPRPRPRPQVRPRAVQPQRSIERRRELQRQQQRRAVPPAQRLQQQQRQRARIHQPGQAPNRNRAQQQRRTNPSPGRMQQQRQRMNQQQRTNRQRRTDQQRRRQSDN